MHRAEIIICPECGLENTGKLQEILGRGVRYGTGVKTWATYFWNQHHIPLERIAQIFEDLTGHAISEGSLLKARLKNFPSASGPRPRRSKTPSPVILLFPMPQYK
ncbi:MAG: hypothetical protein D3924_01445 [Candidatus Electrothrix sp. AR4]|nr:hypothetical protein [Candidatus Electrothrix sp. AR4]